MDSSELTSEDVVERGTRIYDEQLRSILEPHHLGKYVIINVQTGEYELDVDHLTASDRAVSRWPATRLYATRVGSRFIARIGGNVRVNHV